MSSRANALRSRALHWGSAAAWRDIVLPKEHGSWSLALEPVAMGLLAAPSAGGAWLGLAVMAGFFSRRPLRIAWRDANADRRALARSALATLACVAVMAMSAAIATAGLAWTAWLLPTALLGAVFMAFDLRNAGRAETAEIAGAAAFAFLPAAFAILGGWDAGPALALAVLMIGRAVPTVMAVRACLRAAKTGVWRTAPALLAATIALAVGLGLHRAQLLSRTGVVLLALLAVRATLVLVFPRPAWRARTLGMIEAAIGVGFVVVGGLA